MVKTRKILIIDDQEVNRKILGHILETEYEILYAESGEKALMILRENSDQLSAVFLDLIMPGMDGYQVLEAMKADSTLCNIPVIIASQSDGEESEIKALSMGANDFVGKPYKAQIIRQRLKNLVMMREASENLATAERDILTGLYDKRAFYRKANDMIFGSDEQYDLIEADVENFKIFNNAFGYSQGDFLLKHIAETLEAIFEDTDALIARCEGDHFFICVKPVNDITQRLKKAKALIDENSLGSKIIIKFAIYHITDKMQSIGGMCDATSLALEQIKGLYGENIVEYDDSIRQKLLKEQYIASIMKDALEQKQFQVYFQPKYDIRYNRMVGAEALVRWIHPEMGFMSPGEFIPIFENNGFITELDAFVWEEACRFIAGMIRDKGACVPVSVNVSRKDIYQISLPEHMTKLVKKYDLDPKYLHLEITETAYTENTKQLLEVVNDLKDRGFVLEMDDFGSGYSSLNTLSELPIDVLKLDMKFIQNELHHKNTNNIINAIVNLAKWMNLLMITEGVETQEQIDYLKDLDCRFVQGYFFAKPMPEKDFYQLVIANEIAPLFDMKSFVEMEQKNC